MSITRLLRRVGYIPPPMAAVFGDTFFDVLKSVHVLCAALWVGGNFTLNVAINLAYLSRDPTRQSVILRTTEVIGQRVLTVLGLIVVAAGIGFFILTFLVGAGYLGPGSKRAAELIDSGADQDTIRTASVPLRVVAAVDALLLWSVVVVMVVKPT